MNSAHLDTRITRPTGTARSTATADEVAMAMLGVSIASDGIAHHEAAVLRLGCAAQDLGVSPVLIGVLVDDEAPTVARERAFASVVSRMVAASTTGF